MGVALQLLPMLLQQHLELWNLGRNEAIHDRKFPTHHEVGQQRLTRFQSSRLEL